MTKEKVVIPQKDKIPKNDEESMLTLISVTIRSFIFPIYQSLVVEVRKFDLKWDLNPQTLNC